MSKIKFRKPDFKRGFSPNKKTQTFSRVVHKQTNLLKKPFINYTTDDTYPYDGLPALWVTPEPFDAFKRKLRPEERVHDKGHLTLMYPNWKNQIEVIDMRRYVLLDGVHENGFYLAIDKRAANRSMRAQRINQKFTQSIANHDTNYVNVVNRILGGNMSGQFSDTQTIDKLFMARERYWDRTQELIDRYNELKQ